MHGRRGKLCHRALLSNQVPGNAPSPASISTSPRTPAFNTLTAWTDSVWINLSRRGPDTNGGGMLRGVPRSRRQVVSMRPITARTSMPAFRPPARRGSQRERELYDHAEPQHLAHGHLYGEQHGMQYLCGRRPSDVGNVDAHAPNSVPATATCMSAAVRPTTAATTADASVDDFQLYGTVLTAAQIQQLYNNEVGPMNGGLPSTTPVQLASGTTFGPERPEPDHRFVGRSAAGGGGTVTTSIAAPPTAR